MLTLEDEVIARTRGMSYRQQSAAFHFLLGALGTIRSLDELPSIVANAIAFGKEYQ